ncbi:hypothetical protein MNBD_NITROSPINAE02-1320 [hydrothermal vent metagenome]|uniref:Putative regulatory protein FmdB zinc ribbon domain-containing protein n=1 Tax=hydrothermal vent metagenome TaxID=652676 RepID=A0A3B1BFS4_9ZZZZ
MPIYEYKCNKCGEALEVMQKMTDPPLKRHNGAARCGGKLVKLMSSNAFHLKGTGWYKTDYADKEKKAREKPRNGGTAVKKESGEKKEGASSADTAPKKEPAATEAKPTAKKKAEATKE